VTGLALGVLGALVWGTAAAIGGIAARRVGASRTVAWGMLVGIVVALPIALATGEPGRVDLRTAGWIVLVAAGMLSGLAFVYAGVRRGSIAVVAPISATYGGVAALIAVLGGEPLTVLAGIAFALAVVGAVLAARGDTATPGRPSDTRVAVLLGLGAAIVWGIQLWAGGQIGDDLGASWLVAAVRVVGIVVVTLPVLLLGRMRIDRGSFKFVALAGVGEVLGFTVYLLAAGYGVAQASVLTSQYGAVAAIIGVVALGERLRPMQYAGIAMILIAVTLLAVEGAGG
jgi:drug/metabolite transporter (DMT)-like permease